MPYHRDVSARWFRIAYARNAFIRYLAANDRELGELTASRAARAMADFHGSFRPQHGEIDELTASWGPDGDEWQLVFERRMTRHGHPERRLRLALRFSARANDPVGNALITASRDARSIDGVRSARGRARRSVRLDEVTVTNEGVIGPERSTPQTH